MKKIHGVYDAPRPHWVGDGFPVRSMFSYDTHGRQLSPFLLLDHAGPARFEPASTPRGVGQHPHRGFETVTIVYAGEVAHRDSTGAGGEIGPGDVQWMTAAGGILHEEFHSDAFTRRGGTLEMVQLWVNLPAAAKMSAPGYQSIASATIPVVPLADAAGFVRVIAGAFGEHAGPARTFTPMDVWDLRLRRDHRTRLAFPEGHTVAMVILHGTVLLNQLQAARDDQLVVFDRAAGEVELEANTDATVLVLSGEPIDEPIAGYGPFVMNTREQIQQAMDDFRSGRFGEIAARAQLSRGLCFDPTPTTSTHSAAFAQGVAPMNKPVVAVVIGSLRQQSLNRRLALELMRMAGDRLDGQVVEIGDLPLYNQDDDATPAPEVVRLRELIRSVDGVLFVTPEYNRSFPGVLKNAIDHGSRPYGQSVWARKPAGVIGASVGGHGTALAQQHLRNVLAYLDMPTLAQPEAFIHAKEGFFDNDGRVGEGSRKFLEGWVDAYVRWVEAHRAK